MVMGLRAVGRSHTLRLVGLGGQRRLRYVCSGILGVQGLVLRANGYSQYTSSEKLVLYVTPRVYLVGRGILGKLLGLLCITPIGTTFCGSNSMLGVLTSLQLFSPFSLSDSHSKV